MSEQREDRSDVQIIWFLGVIAILGVICLVILELAAPGDSDMQTFVAITSAAVGAMASRLNNNLQPQRSDFSHSMEILGTAVSSPAVARMLRAVAQADDDHPAQGHDEV